MEIASTSKASSQDWWRWALLPFATIGGAVIGAFITWFTLWFGMKLRGEIGMDGWYFRYVMPVLVSAVFGCVYAYIAYEMAPRSKAIAGTVMVTILGVLTVIALLQTWVAPDITIGKQINMTVGGAATMIAAVLTLVEVNGKKA